MKSWPVIVSLGLTQIVGYGTLYYSFSILAPAMARDYGWPLEWIFGALSAALLAGGIAAPKAGRWIDRYGAGRIMAVGSFAAAAGLIACALAPNGSLFVPALVAVEITSTLVQYGAAFPFLVQRHPETGQRSIVYLTLIAGFASTIFWPITTALHSVLSWQEVYFVFAAMHLAICLPIHLWLSRPVRPPAFKNERAAPLTPRAPIDGSLLPAQRQKVFVLMASGFALQSFIGSAILVHMLPVLAALGLGLVGVMVGSLFGPAQVLSRFLNMIFGKNLPQLTLAIISAGLLPLSVSVLLVAPSVPGALAFSVLFGMGHGLYSIVSGTLPLALFGSAGYGARQGQITAVRLVVGSVAPFALALLMEKVGINWTLAVTAALGVGAVLMFYGIIRCADERDPPR